MHDRFWYSLCPYTPISRPKSKGCSLGNFPDVIKILHFIRLLLLISNTSSIQICPSEHHRSVRYAIIIFFIEDMAAIRILTRQNRCCSVPSTVLVHGRHCNINCEHACTVSSISEFSVFVFPC